MKNLLKEFSVVKENTLKLEDVQNFTSETEITSGASALLLIIDNK